MTGKHLSYSQFELIDREFFRNSFFLGGGGDWHHLAPFTPETLHQSMQDPQSHYKDINEKHVDFLNKL